MPVILTGNCSKFFANDESREDAESVVKGVLFRVVHTQEIMLRCVGKLNLYFILILINFFHPGKQGTSSFQLRLPCWQRYPKNLACMVCLHFTASWQYHGATELFQGHNCLALMQHNSHSEEHQSFFIKCSTVPRFLLLPFNGSWEGWLSNR